jgi:thiol-disulfide isomerase/thioredoxin
MGVARFVSLYYLLNFGVPLMYLGFIYPSSRYEPASQCLTLGFSNYLTQEQETALMVFFTYLLKLRSHATIDESVQKLFMLLKLATVLFAFLSGEKSTGITLGAMYSVMFMGLQPPRFKGASNIEHLNPVAMKNRVRSPESKAEGRRVWIVAFWADWCETCNFLEAMLASLSMKYSSEPGMRKREDGLSFGKVDVVKYPELAEEFRIDTSGTSWQLPTLILFYKGVEVRRLPPFKSDGTVVKTKMDVKGVVKYFELDTSVGEMSFKGKGGGKKGN